LWELLEAHTPGPVLTEGDLLDDYVVRWDRRQNPERLHVIPSDG